ncbi:DUF397 domain-containing protein [Streptomyces sp. NBS 14/10]|uniref:DUF397 domain-containing protein n=1 Tax=Streptomyces sp. NBS 14/10 TaxID=1945643 RepID=UPI000B7FBDE2|nr:DUF397 domain-containing protein [Streptomyces sp. NBS 14/10]KAK1178361.1 DUF397 domain-containing protein [Streptomyces sp. NBS 14/10]
MSDNIGELVWFKSSYSGGQCVEVATHPDTVHIRDSKNTTGPILTVTPDAWTRFVGFAAHR